MAIAHPSDERAGPRRRRWSIVIVGSAAVLALGATAMWWTGSERSVALRPEREAPMFRIEDLRDPARSVALTDADGRPMVLNFWASWCDPCRREMPALEDVYEQVRPRISFVIIDNQDARAPALALLQATGVQYPSGFDPSGAVARDYGLYGMPTTVFIAPGGRIVGRIIGELTADRLRSAMSSAFGLDVDGVLGP